VIDCWPRNYEANPELERIENKAREREGKEKGKGNPCNLFQYSNNSIHSDF
jgi:hypothetical protein